MRRDYEIPVLGEPGERPRRVSRAKLAKRIALNAAVVAAFLAAAFALYTLIDSSGILGAEEPVTVTTTTTAPVGVAGLKDIPPDHPEAARIKIAVEEGLVTPARPDAFDPEGAASRADVAIAVVKAAGWTVEERAETGFSDVTDDPDVVDLGDYVSVAIEHEAFDLSRGDPSLFEPEKEVSMRTLMVAMGAPGGDALPAAEDVRDGVKTLDMTRRQKSTFEWLLRVDALDGTGIDPTTIDLEASVTRLQVAVIAANLSALAKAQ